MNNLILSFPRRSVGTINITTKIRRERRKQVGIVLIVPTPERGNDKYHHEDTKSTKKASGYRSHAPAWECSLRRSSVAFTHESISIKPVNPA